MKAQVSKLRKAREVTQERARAVAEREAAAEAKEAEVQADLDAVDTVVSELEAGTLEERNGKVLIRNPAPVRNASDRVRKRLLSLAQRILGLERDVRRNADRLTRLTGALQRGLSRDDLTSDARREGEALRNEADDGPRF